jgi:uncharacterized metal-binding protein YceD (DUF177 family)
MKNSFFSLSLESLAKGDTVSLSFQAPPDFLGIHENELVFKEPIDVEGSAYLASQTLILQLSAKTTAFMPCAICNTMTSFPLSVQNYMFTEEAKNLCSPFDFSEILREALLMELPFFVECKGNCPERATVKSFIKKEQQETYFPFSDLK